MVVSCHTGCPSDWGRVDLSSPAVFRQPVSAWGFAGRYGNGWETSVANPPAKFLKSKGPCSPLGSAREIKDYRLGRRVHVQQMFNIRPEGGAVMERREAFCAAVIKFRSPEWSPAFPDTDTFEVDGQHRTIRQVCELVKGDSAELPDLIVGILMGAMHGDRRLLELLGRSRTYATGSECLLAMLDHRVTTFRTRR
jgi:hypothetical protein